MFLIDCILDYDATKVRVGAKFKVTNPLLKKFEYVIVIEVNVKYIYKSLCVPYNDKLYKKLNKGV